MRTFDDRELSRRVDEVLYYIWDPIGVSEEPFARAEYESYVPKVLELVEKGNFRIPFNYYSQQYGISCRPKEMRSRSGNIIETQRSNKTRTSLNRLRCATPPDVCAEEVQTVHTHCPLKRGKSTFKNIHYFVRNCCRWDCWRVLRIYTCPLIAAICPCP